MGFFKEQTLGQALHGDHFADPGVLVSSLLNNLRRAEAVLQEARDSPSPSLRRLLGDGVDNEDADQIAELDEWGIYETTDLR